MAPVAPGQLAARPSTVKRFPAFDPPEYHRWTPGADAVRRYRKTFRESPSRAEVVDQLDESGLLGIYRGLLTTRLQDIALKRWVRQGVVSKAWLGTGEEAVTVGAVSALDRKRDVVSPMIRNAGACHLMGMPLEDGFTTYLATTASPSGGRDLHAGDVSRGVVQPISHMGASATIVAGAALAFKNRGEARVALTWIGDGATRTAAAHEGMVFAAGARVPAIFVVQNNQVALGTPLAQHAGGRMEDVPRAYGMDALVCDGNNVLDVHAATAVARRRCVEGRGPAGVVAGTFRMGGHATHDEREARETLDARLFEEWGRRDPVGLFEAFLLEEGIASAALEEIEDEASRAVEDAAERALASRGDAPPPERAIYDGFSEGGVLHPLRHRLAGGREPRTERSVVVGGPRASRHWPAGGQACAEPRSAAGRPGTPADDAADHAR